MNMRVGPAVVSAPEVVNASHKEMLLRASYIQDDHSAFRAYMDSFPRVTSNRWFDESLCYLLELVSNKKRTLSDVTPTITILLQYHAKWIPARSFDGAKSLYHEVCLSNDDYHEILELVIKELGLTLINQRDVCGCTALTYAVQNANVKCVEKLIVNGADVNLITLEGIFKFTFFKDVRDMKSPLIDSINLLHRESIHSPNIMKDIFDILLNNEADVNKCCFEHQRTPLMYAAIVDNVYCVKKLIEKGADLFATDKHGRTAGTLAAETGSISVLKYLIESNYLDKDAIDNYGCSVLFWAVRGGNIYAVRYLLHRGVTTTTHTPQEWVEPCQQCTTSLPQVNVEEFHLHACMEAITSNKVDMVRLLDEHGCQSYKHLYALSYAVRINSAEVVKYLLSNYKYPLNTEYYMGGQLRWNRHTTVLTEGCQTTSDEVVKLLLEQGADPNVGSCVRTCSSPINVAIFKQHVEIIACFIRGGVNVNIKSFYPCIGAALPFEAAVWRQHIYAAEMFLHYGSSFGVFSLPKEHEYKVDILPDLQVLLKKWKVHKNNVIPLQKRCRMMILNHLCPQADKKITELPLPPILIRYLRIPELDDIIEISKRNPQTN